MMHKYAWFKYAWFWEHVPQFCVRLYPEPHYIPKRDYLLGGYSIVFRNGCMLAFFFGFWPLWMPFWMDVRKEKR